MCSRLLPLKLLASALYKFCYALCRTPHRTQALHCYKPIIFVEMLFTLIPIMATIPFLAAALPHNTHPRTGAAIPISKRSHLVKRDGSADVDYLRKHIAYVEGKIQRGAAAFERNTGVPLVSAKPRLCRRATGSDPLTDDSSQLWYGSISVGTPPVSYTVDFDTGSSDLFLPGTNCSENCENHKAYDPSASSTSSDIGETFTLSYADGSTVSGEQFVDTVQIEGLVAHGQTLGSAAQYSEGFSSSQFVPDGLMGMAFQSISNFNAPPVFQTLVKEGQTTESLFAFKLATSGSELFIGGVNEDLFTGDVTYVPVTHQAYWEINMDSVSVGSSKAIGTTPVIVDTGTTLIVGDTTSVALVYNTIPGSKDASSTLGGGLFTIPCDSIPTISLTFGGKSFDISPEIFNLGPTQQNSSDCIGGLASSDVSGSVGWIVGDVFLRNVYAVFDFGNSRVGFADLV